MVRGLISKLKALTKSQHMSGVIEQGHDFRCFVRVEADLRQTSELICPLCLQIKRVAVRLNGNCLVDTGTYVEPCGHSFCRPCARRWLEQNSKCPVCPRPAKVDDITPDANVQSLVRGLEVICLLHPSCTQTGLLGPAGDIDSIDEGSLADEGFWHSHCSDCAYQPIACLDCATVVPRQSWAEHASRHTLPTGPASGQELETRAVEAAAAIDALPDNQFVVPPTNDARLAVPNIVLVACQCGCILPRGRLAAHLKLKTCSAVCIQCPFHNDGCPVLIRRGDLNAHLESASVRHLSLVLHAKQQLADRVRSLEEERSVVHAKLVAIGNKLELLESAQRRGEPVVHSVEEILTSVPSDSEGARLYRSGMGATKAETAVHFLRRAVEPPHAHIEAMAELSHRILSGLGAARDPESAFQYATEAAQRSCPTGVSALARCHAVGVGTSVDIERARQLFEVAMEMGDNRWAAYGLACLMREQVSTNEKPDEAVTRLKRIYDLLCSAANAQPPLVVAACEVAKCLEQGVGCSRNLRSAVAAYRRAAELGDGEALLRLGNWHAGLEPAPLSTESTGSSSPKLTPSSTSAFSAVSAATRASALNALVPRDDAAAVECYRQGIELANHVGCMLALGKCYAEGHGVNQNANKAFELHRAAAAAGSGRAHFLVAQALESGTGCPSDMNAANLHYQQGATAGSTQCMYRLGRLAQGRGDHSAACAFFQRAADADDAHSMLALGLCYEAGGVGVHKDECQAAKLYRRAADRGDVRAMVALGLCLQRGVSASTARELGLSDARDEAQAMSLFQRAADGGDGRACFLLGLCFQSGSAGQQPDLRHAAQMFSRGAERDDAPAMVAFGICLEQGLGVDKNETQAVEWYQRAAAKHDDARAIFQLGSCWERGVGVPNVDPAKALAMYRRATEAGNVRACTALGRCLLRGIGCVPNEQRATLLLQRAAVAGDAEAVQILQRSEDQSEADQDDELGQPLDDQHPTEPQLYHHNVIMEETEHDVESDQEQSDNPAPESDMRNTSGISSPGQTLDSPLRRHQHKSSGHIPMRAPSLSRPMSTSSIAPSVASSGSGVRSPGDSSGELSPSRQRDKKGAASKGFGSTTPRFKNSTAFFSPAK